MKRISRHTVVVLIVASLTTIGGLGVAVVAFGQSDATPTSGYTTPTSAYTTPTVATPSPTPTVTAPSSTGKSSPSPDNSSGASKPSRSHGSTKSPSATRSPVATPSQPSRTVRPGPTRLAFTGADPLLLAGGGIVLMLAGLGLHLRRRRATGLEL